MAGSTSFPDCVNADTRQVGSVDRGDRCPCGQFFFRDCHPYGHGFFKWQTVVCYSVAAPLREQHPTHQSENSPFHRPFFFGVALIAQTGIFYSLLCKFLCPARLWLYGSGMLYIHVRKLLCPARLRLYGLGMLHSLLRKPYTVQSAYYESILL